MRQAQLLEWKRRRAQQRIDGSQASIEIRHRLIATLDRRKGICLRVRLAIGRRAGVVTCVPLIHLVDAAHPVEKSLILGSSGR